MSIYPKFQLTAARLLGKFQQGAVRLVRPGETTGPAYAPVKGAAPAQALLSATVQGVPARFVDGSHVLATDLLVTAAVGTGPAPTVLDSVSLDGKLCRIVKVMHMPPVGTTVVWKMAVRA